MSLDTMSDQERAELRGEAQRELDSWRDRSTRAAVLDSRPAEELSPTRETEAVARVTTARPHRHALSPGHQIRMRGLGSIAIEGDVLCVEAADGAGEFRVGLSEGVARALHGLLMFTLPEGRAALAGQPQPVREQLAAAIRSPLTVVVEAAITMPARAPQPAPVVHVHATMPPTAPAQVIQAALPDTLRVQVVDMPEPPATIQTVERDDRGNIDQTVTRPLPKGK